MTNSFKNPVMVLKENTERKKGKDALNNNINVILAIAEAIKSTLGPHGLNKMIVDTTGDITISGDGSKILEEMGVQNPTAQMVVDLSKSINKNFGDGSSSAVIFLGELMKKVQEMTTNGISPRLIYEGFTIGLHQCKEILKKESIEILPTNKEVLLNIAKTALNSKSLKNNQNKFSKIIVDTIQKIEEMRGDKRYIDLDNIQIIKKEGGWLDNTQLIEGIIIDKEIVNSMMPKVSLNSKIALIDNSLEIVKTDFSSEIKISNHEEISSFIDHEDSIVKTLVDSLNKAGANVIFCQKGIDEKAQHYLSNNNIMAIRRVKHSDMKKLSRATGARIITNIREISEADLGSAEKVSEKKIGKTNMIFVENCLEPKSVTILIRGGTEHIVDDLERSINNGLHVVKSVVENPKIVYGAGSIEIELRKRLLDYTKKIGGMIQIPIREYANSIEIIPKVIVENSGKDPLDIITSLRSKVDYSIGNFMGFDSFSRKIINSKSKSIIEPLSIKIQILSMATELAVTFIRIDEYIRLSK